MGTLETIFLATFIKGALVTVMVKKGWWPDWEERAYKREESKRVFQAYERWCEQSGQRPFEDPKIPERLKFRPTGRAIH